MSRMILVLATLVVAGPALAADAYWTSGVASAQASMEEARTAPTATNKVGPLVTARQARARKQLNELIEKAKGGQPVNVGEIDVLIEQATR